ncbi:MAG: DUF4915 domain-containing protein [Chloroflexota bacterium]|nr:MAG: DUF4915 domain-containing protein [Chloroflexota bacterium]
MSAAAEDVRAARWSRHHTEWRDPAQIIGQWRDVAIDPSLLEMRVTGDWWDLLGELGITLLVTREYEHLAIGLSRPDRSPRIAAVPMPHPSGLAVDRARRRVWIASTRNPNQLFEFAPVVGVEGRSDRTIGPISDRPLVSIQSRTYPGSLYMHDLALVGDRLHANAVGQNAIATFEDDSYRRVWWPRCIESEGVAGFSCNYLQLNSIAAGESLETSYFSASADRPAARRPGHRNFVVDRRGVIFDGATREVAFRGLTRPHSARLRDGVVWVDNSGYGQLARCSEGKFDVVAQLPGWTRGLSFVGSIGFVGTSRVIPRFSHYAPGLDIGRSECGVHAVDLTDGTVRASVTWPNGNQIFAVDWIETSVATGFPSRAASRRVTVAERNLFYAFKVN